MSHDELRHELRSLLGAARALVEAHRSAGAAGLPVEAAMPWPPQVDDLLVGFVASAPVLSARTPPPAPPPAPQGEGSAATAATAAESGGGDTEPPFGITALPPLTGPVPSEGPPAVAVVAEVEPVVEASAAELPVVEAAALPVVEEVAEPPVTTVPVAEVVVVQAAEPPLVQVPIVEAPIAPPPEASPPPPRSPLPAAQGEGPGVGSESSEPTTLAALVTPLIEGAPVEAASLFAGEPTQGYFPGLGDGLDASRPKPAAGLRADLPPPRTEAAHRHLEVLAQRISQCTACELHRSRTQTVFARGNPDAEVCFIGEAPGASEDEQGLPFVSPAGQLLDRMIAAMGLSQDEVYITTLCRCRPPGDRAPTTEEMATCMPFLREQLAVTRPRVIVALGATATKGLLQTSLGIRALRGTWKLYRTTPLMPTYHPAYLLRETEAGRLDAKREVWKDLQAVLERMGRSLPSRGKS